MMLRLTCLFRIPSDNTVYVFFPIITVFKFYWNITWEINHTAGSKLSPHGGGKFTSAKENKWAAEPLIHLFEYFQFCCLYFIDISYSVFITSFAHMQHCFLIKYIPYTLVLSIHLCFIYPYLNFDFMLNFTHCPFQINLSWRGFLWY